MKLLIFISFFLFSFASMALECPLGAKETELSLSRVMRNFGRFSREAEMVGLNGREDPSNVKEASLIKAINDLEIVIACADRTLINPTLNLYPRRYFELKTDLEKATYMEQFFSIMTEFKNSTIEFMKLLVDEKMKSIDNRSYKKVYEYAKIYNEIVDRAHDVLTDE